MKYWFYFLLLFLLSCSSSTKTNLSSNLNFQKEPLFQSQNIHTEEKPQLEEVVKQLDESEIILEEEVKGKINTQKDNISLISTRLKRLETLLAEKELEIETLKKQANNNIEDNNKEQGNEQDNEQSTENNQEQSISNNIVTEALERELGNSFQIPESQLKLVEIENKELDVEKQESLSKQIEDILNKQNLQFNSIQVEVLKIADEEILPELLLKPPRNPKILSKNSGIKTYRSAYEQYKKKEYEQAIESFHQYIQDYPQDKAVDNAYYWIGMSFWKQNKPDIAKKYFVYILKNFVFTSTDNGGKTADAMLILGRIVQTKMPQDSKKYYQKVIELYPSSPAAVLANRLLHKIP